MSEHIDRRGFSARRAFALALIAMGAALLSLAAASASAQIPPDNSAVDEYTENVPGAGGDQSSNNVGNGSGGDNSGGGGSLPPETERDLQQAGPTGEAAADLAEVGTPQTQADGSDRGDGGDRGNEAPEDDGATVGDASGDDGSATLASAGSDSDGGSGMGPGLFIALGVIALAAVAFFVARRRSEGQPGPA